LAAVAHLSEDEAHVSSVERTASSTWAKEESRDSLSRGSGENLDYVDASETSARVVRGLLLMTKSASGFVYLGLIELDP